MNIYSISSSLMWAEQIVALGVEDENFSPLLLNDKGVGYSNVLL
jgi:hypothetical protein